MSNQYTPAQVQAAILRLLAQQYATRGDVARDAGIAASGGQSSGGAVSLVYRPGGIAGGNVYTSWAALYAALPPAPFGEQRSPVTILVDDTIVSPAVIPAGTYELENTTFQGVASFTSTGGGAVLSLADGVVFSVPAAGMNLFFTGGIQVESQSATTPVMTVGGSAEVNLYCYDAMLQSLGAAPLVKVTTGFAWVQTVECAQLGDGTHTTFQLSGAGGLTVIAASTYVAAACVAGDGSQVYWDAVIPDAQGSGPVAVVQRNGFIATSPMSPAQSDQSSAINQILRDSNVQVKSTDQSVTSSTVLVNEVGMGAVTMLATDTWEVRWRLYVAYASAAGIALAVTVPTGATLLLTANGMGAAAGGLSVCSSAVEATGGTAVNVLDGTGTGVTGVIDVVATVIGDNTHAGSIQLQFTQTGSSATSTTIKAGSSMRASRVE